MKSTYEVLMNSLMWHSSHPWKDQLPETNRHKEWHKHLCELLKAIQREAPADSFVHALGQP